MWSHCEWLLRDRIQSHASLNKVMSANIDKLMNPRWAKTCYVASQFKKTLASASFEFYLFYAPFCNINSSISCFESKLTTFITASISFTNLFKSTAYDSWVMRACFGFSIFIDWLKLLDRDLRFASSFSKSPIGTLRLISRDCLLIRGLYDGWKTSTDFRKDLHMEGVSWYSLFMFDSLAIFFKAFFCRIVTDIRVIVGLKGVVVFISCSILVKFYCLACSYLCKS